MREFLLATAIAAVAATNAQAAETTGTVRSVNTRSDSITLSDGTTYSLPEGIEAESVKSWREGQDQIFF
ncbi:MAG TPA: DUF1344 domain-containing protein [Bradyrhizobium sp.]|jgi:hypothetical protein|uniref:DUF1344 domain-containing protein n=1 Tax=Bradyrhizobium sp. CCH5-F6 TaxID=1768753 RepID=UPI0009E74A3E|nr:DUF1344 domain-containing protein [Bradyrhizobium sp. CCH5-F6]HXH43383.1 DUF1344 domain-containing protein [Bradyrhizobium sp.]